MGKKILSGECFREFCLFRREFRKKISNNTGVNTSELSPSLSLLISASAATQPRPICCRSGLLDCPRASEWSEAAASVVHHRPQTDSRLLPAPPTVLDRESVSPARRCSRHRPLKDHASDTMVQAVLETWSLVLSQSYKNIRA